LFGVLPSCRSMAWHVLPICWLCHCLFSDPAVKHLCHCCLAGIAGCSGAYYLLAVPLLAGRPSFKARVSMFDSRQLAARQRTAYLVLATIWSFKNADTMHEAIQPLACTLQCTKHHTSPAYLQLTTNLVK
jgi:hypothetical protein